MARTGHCAEKKKSSTQGRFAVSFRVLDIEFTMQLPSEEEGSTMALNVSSIMNTIGFTERGTVRGVSGDALKEDLLFAGF